MTETETFSSKEGNQTCLLLSAALRFSIPYTSRQNKVRPSLIPHDLPPKQDSLSLDPIHVTSPFKLEASKQRKTTQKQLFSKLATICVIIVCRF